MCVTHSVARLTLDAQRGNGGYGPTLVLDRSSPFVFALEVCALVMWMSGVVAVPAEAATNCGAEGSNNCEVCVGLLECHWCSTTGKCILIGDQSCGPATVESGSECTACRTFHECGPCASAPHCEWCQRGQRCLSESESNLSTCPAGALANTGTDCPVLDCGSYTDCTSCAARAACGWCGVGNASGGRCVYKGETSSCGGPHANFESECSDRNAGPGT
jgi:hypothetical protein